MKSMIKEEISRIRGIMSINEDDVGRYIDSTYLQTAEQAGVDEFETDKRVFDTIKDAIEHDMKLVMLRPEYVAAARALIDRQGYSGRVLVGTVIGFPHGNSEHGTKMDEALEAIQNGVDELDFVVDYNAFKSGNLDKVMKEVSEGTAIGIDERKTVKWIIESAALSSEEIAELTGLISKIAVETVGPEKARNVFVKTSTGFYKPESGGHGGATTEDVSIMSQNAGPLQVKASGGIYSKDDLQKMLDAGATRIGTSVAKEIILDKETDTNY